MLNPISRHYYQLNSWKESAESQSKILQATYDIWPGGEMLLDVFGQLNSERKEWEAGSHDLIHGTSHRQQFYFIENNKWNNAKLIS